MADHLGFTIRCSRPVIISASPSEGKPIVSTNLAIILAQSEKSVLLIDADLRRPKIHKLLGILNRIGLSDLIRLRAEIEDIFQSYRNIREFSVNTSGALPPNLAELLSSNRIQQIVDDLMKRYNIGECLYSKSNISSGF